MGEKTTQENTATSQSYGQKICGKCGEYPAYINSELCLNCLDTERKEAGQKERVNNPEKFMQRWGFPQRFIGWTREMILPHLQKLLDKCLTESGLYLTGTAGSGKTCFSAVLGKELIRQGKEVWFKNTTDLLFEVKGTFDKDSKIFNDYEMICNWAAKPYLILDDIGSEKVSEYVRQSLYVLINKRYLDDLPTIITSNLTMQELSGRLDDRIASRLTEMCKMIHLGERDLRVYKQK